MASAVGELRRILGEFNSQCGASVSAIVSRSGIPIAWIMPSGIHIENFAALAATLLGASEVIYTGMGKQAPGRIIVESKEGVLVVSGLGQKAFIAAMFPDANPEIDASMEKVCQAAMDVLKGQS